MANLKEIERYHKKKSKIDETILKTLNDGEVIYGEQALRARFPKHLQRQTEDYDVFAEKARAEAREAERKLDKLMKFNAFKVKKAQHPGTYKVVSNVSGIGYADFTKPDFKPPYNTIKKRRYITLEWIKNRIMQNLRNPEAKFRRLKDRDALNRIKIYEAMKKKVKKKTKLKPFKFKSANIPGRFKW